MLVSIDSFKTKKKLQVGDKTFFYFSLEALQNKGIGPIDRLPFSLKRWLENLLRFEDGDTVTQLEIKAVAQWAGGLLKKEEIPFRPARVFIHDSAGLFVLIDLAALREAAQKQGGDPTLINPQLPVDWVIHCSHSESMVWSRAFDDFFQWGQQAFKNVHRVHLNDLTPVMTPIERTEEHFLFLNSVIETMGHTTGVNAFGIFSWNLCGMEVESAMLNPSMYMQIPEIIGFNLEGQLLKSVKITQLSGIIKKILAEKNVNGKFIEFCGDGLDLLSVPARIEIVRSVSELCPRCVFFPIDCETIKYLSLYHSSETLSLIEAYAKAQGLWRNADTIPPVFTEVLYLNLSHIEDGVESKESNNRSEAMVYPWKEDLTSIQPPPFFKPPVIQARFCLKETRILAILGDQVTTDQISSSGLIRLDSPAGSYLVSQRVEQTDFDSYERRRGNHEILSRGAFNQVCNEMFTEKEGMTRHTPSQEILPIYDAAMKYQKAQTPLVIVAGKTYGVGSSSDWAAKSAFLLGIKAILAESFDPIHRNLLIKMGIMPLEFKFGMSQKSLRLSGSEVLDFIQMSKTMRPRMDVLCRIRREDHSTEEFFLLCRIDTQRELTYFCHGGIFQYFLNSIS